MNAQFPLHLDERGRTATSAEDRHIREMIEQLLFTSPGERVMRPEFGCGVLQLAFAPNGDQLAAAVQVNIQSSLQRWLGDVIQVHALEVTANDSTLRVELAYQVIRSGDVRRETFERRSLA